MGPPAHLIKFISIHVPRVEDDFGLELAASQQAISIHVPRVEDDKYIQSPQMNDTTFQSTSPVWRTTRVTENAISLFHISIHVPRVEDDEKLTIPPKWYIIFQSTSPVWRTTLTDRLRPIITINFNPRPPCGGRRGQYDIKSIPKGISIHVPRVEDDLLPLSNQRWKRYFNPRPPCGGRLTQLLRQQFLCQFQSTSPVWRTTQWSIKSDNFMSNFNPRPPCGGRRRNGGLSGKKRTISIHVPRVEDDTGCYDLVNRYVNFNPRPPCGGRRFQIVLEYRVPIFQSTSPVWRTTSMGVLSPPFHFISIHVPRVEDDAKNR